MPTFSDYKYTESWEVSLGPWVRGKIWRSGMYNSKHYWTITVMYVPPATDVIIARGEAENLGAAKIAMNAHAEESVASN